MTKTFWQGKPWQAFKNFAIIFSFAVNAIFLIVLLAAAPLIIPIVNDVAEPLVGGLNDSFVQMGQAKISRTIEVNDVIPIAFTLPLSTETVVTTTAAVPLQVPAEFILPDNGGTIRGIVAIELPANLPLPVQLALEVPVDQQIPVALSVDVNIPLQETELGQPFSQLQQLFDPLDRLLTSLPSSNAELLQRLRGRSLPPEETAVDQAQRP
ncbi:MAG: hypothetical protein Fur0021_26390 [Candidatus Promineifilaceae bacterium]